MCGSGLGVSVACLAGGGRQVICRELSCGTACEVDKQVSWVVSGMKKVDHEIGQRSGSETKVQRGWKTLLKSPPFQHNGFSPWGRLRL